MSKFLLSISVALVVTAAPSVYAQETDREPHGARPNLSAAAAFNGGFTRLFPLNESALRLIDENGFPVVDPQTGAARMVARRLIPQGASIPALRAFGAVKPRACFNNQSEMDAALSPQAAALIDLDQPHAGDLSGQFCGGPGDSQIPAGFTFLGQFVDHDVTFDIFTELDELAGVEQTPNTRTPNLDLDSIYGDGPEAQPFLYHRGVKLRLGARLAKDDPVLGERRDLLRVGDAEDGSLVAVIGDPRNDENLVISQLQSAFIALHNVFVDKIVEERLSGEFRRVRRLVGHVQQIRSAGDGDNKPAGRIGSLGGVDPLSPHDIIIRALPSETNPLPSRDTILRALPSETNPLPSRDTTLRAQRLENIPLPPHDIIIRDPSPEINPLPPYDIILPFARAAVSEPPEMVTQQSCAPETIDAAIMNAVIAIPAPHAETVARFITDFRKVCEDDYAELRLFSSDEREEIMEEARAHTVHYYHRALLEDFLPHVIGHDRTESIVRNGRLFFYPNGFIGENETLLQPNLPVEFSVAAYRFGHSLVRDAYRLNADQTLPLFTMRARQGGADPTDDMRGFGAIEAENIVDWRLFFAPVAAASGADAQSGANCARLLDERLSNVLYHLPFINRSRSSEARCAAPDPEESLAARNLNRGRVYRLPSGQDIQTYLEPLTQTPAVDGASPSLRFPPLSQANLSEGAKLLTANGDTPLWLYILVEAGQHRVSISDDGRISADPVGAQAGQVLGPIGGLIVGETLIGLMDYYRNQTSEGLDFIPSITVPTTAEGRMTMRDLLVFADQIGASD